MEKLLLEFLERYLRFLGDTFMYDMEVLSQGWMYWLLLIPVMFYLVFFMIKWAVITAPIWLPIKLALQGLRNLLK